MQKEARLKRIRTRKNFLFTLILILMLWAGLGAIVYFLNPEAIANVFLFLLVVFLASFLTFATIFENTRRGLITSLSIALFLALRYFQLGNILNLVLILGIAISVEIYYSRKN